MPGRTGASNNMPGRTLRSTKGEGRNSPYTIPEKGSIGKYFKQEKLEKEKQDTNVETEENIDNVVESQPSEGANAVTECTNMPDNESTITTEESKDDEQHVESTQTQSTPSLATQQRTSDLDGISPNLDDMHHKLPSDNSENRERHEDTDEEFALRMSGVVNKSHQEDAQTFSSPGSVFDECKDCVAKDDIIEEIKQKTARYFDHNVEINQQLNFKIREGSNLRSEVDSLNKEVSSLKSDIDTVNNELINQVAINNMQRETVKQLETTNNDQSVTIKNLNITAQQQKQQLQKQLAEKTEKYNNYDQMYRIKCEEYNRISTTHYDLETKLKDYRREIAMKEDTLERRDTEIRAVKSANITLKQELAKKETDFNLIDSELKASVNKAGNLACDLCKAESHIKELEQTRDNLVKQLQDKIVIPVDENVCNEQGSINTQNKSSNVLNSVSDPLYNVNTPQGEHGSYVDNMLNCIPNVSNVQKQKTHYDAMVSPASNAGDNMQNEIVVYSQNSISDVKCTPTNSSSANVKTGKASSYVDSLSSSILQPFESNKPKSYQNVNICSIHSIANCSICKQVASNTNHYSPNFSQVSQSPLQTASTSFDQTCMAHSIENCYVCNKNKPAKQNHVHNFVKVANSASSQQQSCNVVNPVHIQAVEDKLFQDLKFSDVNARPFKAETVKTSVFPPRNLMMLGDSNAGILAKCINRQGTNVSVAMTQEYQSLDNLQPILDNVDTQKYDGIMICIQTHDLRGIQHNTEMKIDSVKRIANNLVLSVYNFRRRTGKLVYLIPAPRVMTNYEVDVNMPSYYKHLLDIETRDAGVVVVDTAKLTGNMGKRHGVNEQDGIHFSDEAPTKISRILISQVNTISYQAFLQTSITRSLVKPMYGKPLRNIERSNDVRLKVNSYFPESTVSIRGSGAGVINAMRQLEAGIKEAKAMNSYNYTSY